MYKGTNPAALRSQQAITTSFVELSNNLPFNDISIKLIMAQSGLARQTFYQIFSSKEEIVELYLETIFAKYIKKFAYHELESLCDIAKIYFSFFEQHKDFIVFLIRNGKSTILQKKCREFLESNQYLQFSPQGLNSDTEKGCTTAFIISGIVGLLEYWFNDKTGSDKLDADQMALLVCRITNSEAESRIDLKKIHENI